MSRTDRPRASISTACGARSGIPGPAAHRARSTLWQPCRWRPASHGFHGHLRRRNVADVRRDRPRRSARRRHSAGGDLTRVAVLLLLSGERLRDKARDTMILTWAGLRGGISIALALNAARLAPAHGFIGRDLRRGNFHHCRAGIGDLAFPAGPLTERNGSPRRCTSYFNALGFDFCWYAACELFPQAWS